mmetsp:Transcript_18387/g.34713  ORF Transcript_18387/g.34713 Transcript_18387/m.34713 type:complete len:227 (-) Transcript_18387:178-858(-)|eukprot:CAMPEP_0170174910 /NCGR_PEP_ID=MMETSP0040_2-20121228/8089_1 /TAXON_ID=641309 /ORGANISM="Lotharella oceanica, Strain CCMP622" /LENGTH=226 /DNA_ID=CAMNT_0010416735 /DNA_START=188 /DNA_END=868 /DNA_ORIENTATION=+
MYQPVPEEDTSSDFVKERQESPELEGLTDKDTVEINVCQVGKGRHQVRASLAWTVAQFKRAHFRDEVKANKNVRLIFQGKLLHDENTLEEVGLVDKAFMHCSVCEFNPAVVNDPQDENHNANHNALHRDLEDAQIPPWLLQEFTRQGTNGDFILGFIMGFFLGVLTLIWVWQRAVPRRQKLGIMLGFGCNLVLSFVQVANQQHDHQTNGSRPPAGGGTNTDPGIGN